MLMPVLLGALVGLVLALTGAGGAIIAVPLLIMSLGLSLPQAAPVAMLAVGAAATLATVIGLRQGIVRYRAALLIAAVGSLSAPLGVALAHHLPARPLTLGFVAVLAYVAQRLYRQARRELGGTVDEPDAQDAAACRISAQTGRFQWTAHCTRVLLQTGLLSGLLSGLFGVGGGFVIVPALRRSTDLPMNAIVATSLMAIMLVAITTVGAAVVAGHVDLAIALPFAGGAVAAMLAGRQLAARLAGPRLQQGFALLLVLVAGGLAVHALA